MKNKSSEVNVEKITGLLVFSLLLDVTMAFLEVFSFYSYWSVLCFIKTDLIKIWLFVQFNFRGIVSSCFEPHLTVYVELEEKTLMESLEKLVQVICVSPFRYVLCYLLVALFP